MADLQTLLGRGVIVPLRRQGSDVVSAPGGALIESNLKQLMQTRKGELRWKPDFGLSFDKYRHKNITEELMAEIQADAVEQISRFIPQLELEQITVEPMDDLKSTTVNVKIEWRGVTRSRQGMTPLTDSQTTAIPI